MKISTFGRDTLSSEILLPLQDINTTSRVIGDQ